jgi:signal transduction histidine kinase
VVRNLVTNAIEHGEAKPIDVYVGGDPRALAITVRDHGLGFRPEDGALVFGRFWRADPARSRVVGGTGLGLAIAQEDVHLHRGRISAWGRRGAQSGSPFPQAREDVDPTSHDGGGRMRRRTSVLGALLGASGCTALPTSGPVRTQARFCRHKS